MFSVPDHYSKPSIGTALSDSDREILTPEAIEFLGFLHASFEDRRRKLLARRIAVQHEIDLGMFPNFLPGTRSVREDGWEVRRAPNNLRERKIEIMVPAADGLTTTRALGSGANVVIADLEDTQAPTWGNVIASQRNLREMLSMSISWCAPDGRLVELDRDSTTVMIRPRGLHQTERHYSLGGAPISGSFFDFGLFIWHNGQDLVRRESGPYICLAKLENRLEARLWNDIFTATETALGLPPCSIRATVGIDSVLAGFEMEEILYELRDRVTALSLGRANYLFSVAKKFGKHPEFVLPDGDYQTAVPMIDAVDTLMVQMCHRRGAHAIGDVGGLVADHASGRSTARAMEILRRRVLRDAEAGHDGVLVSDPEFCGFARTMLDEKVSGANQLAVLGRLNPIGATDLLRAPSGEFQYAALRRHTETAIHQLSSWLRGGGLVRRQDAMLNSATTELSRSLLWQWYHHRVLTSDGCILTPGHWQTCLDEVVTTIYESVGADRFTEDHYDVAARLMRDLVVDPDFVQFFPLRAGIHLSAE